MKSFPMFIRTTGRRVVIVGGGEQAAQKARLMLKTDAVLAIAAPVLEDELAALVAQGRARHETGPLTPALFDGAAMAFVGTGCPALDVAAHGLAQAARCPVNVVDRPDLCEITTPALVDRDPVVIAIGTEGTAPVLAREIKTRLEVILPPSLGGLAALAGRLRGAVARGVAREGRRAFWAWVFKDAPRALWTRGAEREAAATIKAAIAAGGAPRAEQGSIALVGAGPGARDLLTLRAVERLQEADVIFYDRLVDEDVLELARRDAERIYVGKVVGAHAWPQDRINARIVAEARAGRQVVRLKSGDPGVFGRAGEEVAAAEAAGIPLEIVPGVTAACAAAASLGRSLTERHVADTLVMATGTGAGGLAADSTRHARPGTTTVFYMATRQAAGICAALLDRGMPADSPVAVIADASKPSEKRFSTTLADMPDRLACEGVCGCAVIIATWRQDGASIESLSAQVTGFRGARGKEPRLA